MRTLLTLLASSATLAAIGGMSVASDRPHVQDTVDAGVDSVPEAAIEIDQPDRPQLLHDNLRHLAVGDVMLIEGVALTDEETVDLAVQRFDVLTGDANVIVSGAGGDRFMSRPDVVLLRGYIQDRPGTRVFLGASPTATNGFLQVDGEVHIISTGPHREQAADQLAVSIARARDLFADALPGPGCQTDVHDPKFTPNGQPMHRAAARRGHSQSVARGSAPCRVIRMAIETDWQFTAIFGGDTNASAAYAMTLMAAVSEIFRNDLNISIVVPWLRVWSSDVDPYSAGSTGGRLGELRDEWVGNYDDIERELVHLLSGAGLGGGVAYLDVLCSYQWGYAVSANLGGSFPNPIVDNNHGNWDLMVTAHETGHNVGTGHTHDSYDPPIDNCGNGDVENNCEGADEGTIMSYCHTCPGGMSNININFHPGVVDYLLNLLPDRCDITAGPTTAAYDIASTLQDHEVTIDVLANDAAVSCDPAQVVLGSFDDVSTEGGSIELIASEGEGDPDMLMYTPPDGFAGNDSFTYELESGEVATVDINVVAPRPAEAITNNPVPGVRADYFIIPESSVLPDFGSLALNSTDVVSDVNYPSTGGAFATSGLSDLVAASFTGYYSARQLDFYTFYTNSDDGSRLYIGDQLVVENDGLHGMRERSGTIALAPGLHRIRVEFFENFGGAGLIVSVESSSQPKSPISSKSWTHEAAPCPGDGSADNVVDLADLLGVLAGWGQEGALPFDVTNDGVINLADLLAVLSNWGSTCE